MKKVLNKVSIPDISVKNNYKKIRFIQELLRPDFLYSKNYEDIIFELDDRKIKTRVFKNFPNNKKTKLIIFIHGGGWTTGSVSSYSKTCMELSKKTERAVIAIDYRLAPEYPFPCGFNDCYEIVKIIMDNLSQINMSEDDVCLMGDSAGGNLVSAISLRGVKEKTFRVRDQILLYPALQSDYSNNTKYKSVIEKGKGYFLTQKQLQEYVDLYVKDPAYLKSPYVSPLNKRLPFLQPRTLIVTCEHDPLKDEGNVYAKKLKLCLNYVRTYDVKGATHGFFNNVFGKKYMNELYERIIEFLGDKKYEDK